MRSRAHRSEDPNCRWLQPVLERHHEYAGWTADDHLGVCGLWAGRKSGSAISSNVSFSPSNSLPHLTASPISYAKRIWFPHAKSAAELAPTLLPVLLALILPFPHRPRGLSKPGYQVPSQWNASFCRPRACSWQDHGGKSFSDDQAIYLCS